MSQVYFIQCGATRLIKIGFSNNALRRLRNMQTGSPSELTLLGVEDGDQERERDLHVRFAEQRRRGEWFEPNEEMLAHIATLPPVARKRSGRDYKTIPGTKLHDRALSEAIGLCQTGCHDMRSGKRPIQIKHALALHAFNGDRIGRLRELSDDDIESLHRIYKTFANQKAA